MSRLLRLHRARRRPQPYYLAIGGEARRKRDDDGSQFAILKISSHRPFEFFDQFVVVVVIMVTVLNDGNVNNGGVGTAAIRFGGPHPRIQGLRYRGTGRYCEAVPMSLSEIPQAPGEGGVRAHDDVPFRSLRQPLEKRPGAVGDFVRLGRFAVIPVRVVISESFDVRVPQQVVVVVDDAATGSAAVRTKIDRGEFRGDFRNGSTPIAIEVDGFTNIFVRQDFEVDLLHYRSCCYFEIVVVVVVVVLIIILVATAIATAIAIAIAVLDDGADDGTPRGLYAPRQRRRDHQFRFFQQVRESKSLVVAVVAIAIAAVFAAAAIIIVVVLLSFFFFFFFLGRRPLLSSVSKLRLRLRRQQQHSFGESTALFDSFLG